MSSRCDRGSVTGELAVALPAVVLVVALAAGALGAASRQVRLQDVAADAARLVARGEDRGRADAIVASAVGGATVSVEERGDLVCVSVTGAAGVPLPLPALRATSCALGGGL